MIIWAPLPTSSFMPLKPAQAIIPQYLCEENFGRLATTLARIMYSRENLSSQATYSGAVDEHPLDPVKLVK